MSTRPTVAISIGASAVGSYLCGYVAMSLWMQHGGAIQGTVWDGLTSANPLVYNGKVTTVANFLIQNAASVGATTIAVNSNAIYLGSTFFNPGEAGITGFYGAAQG